MVKRVVFFGSIPIARECLEIVQSRPDVEVVGVCAAPLDGWRTEQSVWAWCETEGVPLIDHSDIPALTPDLGISVRYHRILSADAIESFANGVVNVHGGLLPEYRGSYSNIHALINREEDFGVTLHYIAAGIDTGDVIARKSVKIKDTDTGMSLYLAGERLCVEVIRENLNCLLDGSVTSTPQSELIAAGSAAGEYRRADIETYRYVSFDELAGKLHIVRAFDSPHHEPSYTIVGGTKVFLRVT